MYEVRFFKGNYRPRQEAANRAECAAYVEQHFNSFRDPSASYSIAIVGFNASQTSRNWGRWYAQAIGREFGIPVRGSDGIVVGGFNGRGDFNLRFTDMPAILLEPLFASNPQHAEWIRSAQGRSRLARVLCDSIERFFPSKEGERTLIGFSVGHKYKDTNPADRGAALYGWGHEADCAEMVLEEAKTMLEALDGPPQEREIRVLVNGEERWREEIDADADVAWDPVRGVLEVNQPSYQPGGQEMTCRRQHSENYEVADDPVTLSISYGDGQDGMSKVKLDGEDLGLFGEVNDHPLGEGPNIAGKTLRVKTTVNDMNDITNNTSVTYKLRGGVNDLARTLRCPVEQDGDVCIYRVQFALKGSGAASV